MIANYNIRSGNIIDSESIDRVYVRRVLLFISSAYVATVRRFLTRENQNCCLSLQATIYEIVRFTEQHLRYV